MKQSYMNMGPAVIVLIDRTAVAIAQGRNLSNRTNLMPSFEKPKRECVAVSRAMVSPLSFCDTI